MKKVLLQSNDTEFISRLKEHLCNFEFVSSPLKGIEYEYTFSQKAYLPNVLKSKNGDSFITNNDLDYIKFLMFIMDEQGPALTEFKEKKWEHR